MVVTTVTKYVPQSSTNHAKNAARDKRRDNHALEFIGVDGEGIGNDYIMLSVGDETLHNNGRRLTHADIFPFLWDHFSRNPHAVYVGFALTYDFTMWLKNLGELDAYALFDKAGIAARQPRNDTMRQPFPVRHPTGEWEFDLMGNGKRFRLRPNARRYGTDNAWLYVSDVFGYWQTSFVNAINPDRWQDPICTPKEYAVILEGKRKRNTAVFDEDMRLYNITENLVLARMMQALNKGLVTSTNVRLRRAEWYGPGQAAQKWLGIVKAPTRESMIDATPGPVRMRSIEAYYGGWFENMRHGIHKGKAYSYDLISAYPAIIAELPCLLHGKWKRLRGLPGPNTLALVYGEFRGPNEAATGPLPYRTREGHIQRVRRFAGTYWWHEIQAARNAKLLPPYEFGINWREIWAYYPACDHPPPLRGIRELYQKRLSVDKASPQGKALKVIMNSAYGKTAQTVGNPKYSNMLYAGIITSLCRTQILEAIASHPNGADSVLMVNTDGITFDSPNPNLRLSDTELGAWETSEQTDLCLFMPGVYWETNATAAKIKRRGMPLAAAEYVKEEGTRQFESWEPGTPWPRIEVEIPWQFITAKLAYSRGKWNTAGTSVYNALRAFNSYPYQKRYPREDTLESIPYSNGTDMRLISTPYKKAEFVFGWEEQLDKSLAQDEEWRAEMIDSLKGDGSIV